MRRLNGLARIGLLLTAACAAEACGSDPVAGTAGATEGTGSSGSVQTTTTSPTNGTVSDTVTTTSPTSGMTEAMTSDVTTTGTTGPIGITSSTGDFMTGDFTTGVDTDTTDTDTDTGEGPRCGNGVIDVDEGCDDGDLNGPGMACNGMCMINVCGDGDQGPGEECDDGANNGDANSCTSICKNAFCGDGRVGPGEGCDDGNQNDNDECGNYSSFPATAPTRRLTSKLHGRNRWVFSRPATGPPTASPQACPPGLEKCWRRALA